MGVAIFGYGVVENGQLKTMIVSIPVITKVGKSKRWKGYKVEDFEEKNDDGKLWLFRTV